jgi:LAO/AO transport system kinase
LFVVNKADRDGTQSLVRELRTMIAMADRDPAEWKPPILRTVAIRHEGIDELVAALDKHRAHTEADGSWQHRRLERARSEVESLAMAVIQRRLHSRRGAVLDELAAAVRDGRVDAFSAADQVIEEFGGS